MTPPPPEIVAKKSDPAALLARLARMRDLYTHGVLSADQFNAFLAAYRFRDEQGVIWSPGGRTSRWYRWDGTRWVLASPSAALMLDGLTPPRAAAASAAGAAGRQSSPASDPVRAERACPKCGARPAPRQKFCTTCGTEVPQP